MTERDIREAIRATCNELDEGARQREVAQHRGLRRALLPALVGAGLAVAGCSEDVVDPGGEPVYMATSTGTTSSTSAGGGGQGGEAGQGGEGGQGGVGGQTAQGGGGQGGGGGEGGMGAPVYMAPDVFV